MATETLRTTPLADIHRAAGGRMVPFAGWEMPIQYETGVITEHNAVRTSVGMFDVSHMGQFEISGESAFDDLQHLLSNDLSKLEDGKAQYTLLTNERGGIEDDLIVYRQGPDSYLLVVNAGNIAHDRDWIASRLSTTTAFADVSDEFGMIALQGPTALDVLATLGLELRGLHPFHFVEPVWNGIPLTIATTGYTGESGCEIIAPHNKIGQVWSALAETGDVTLCGLGARDTLRLEACYPLHGNDIGPDTSAVQAGLAWVCGWGTGFVGEDALAAEREAGPAQRLVSLRMTEKAIPRAGNPLRLGDASIGQVTSGTMSPTLEQGIALAYVDAAHASVDTALEVDIRGRIKQAVVTKKPFYSSKEKPA